MTEKPERYTKEWYEWCHQQEETRKAAIEAEKAIPITRGELHAALKQTIDDVRGYGYEPHGMDAEVRDIAESAIVDAFEKLMGKLGIGDKWDWD